MQDESVLDHPIPSKLSKKAVWEFAEFIGDTVKFPSKKSLRDLVADFGGRVEVGDSWGQNVQKSESLHVDSEGQFVIYITQHTTLERDNFTIAHELGHYVLHYLWATRDGDGKKKPFVAFRYGSKFADERTEWEANWFAAALLMPKAAFERSFNELNGSIPLLADRFSVTQKAAKVRAIDLGLLQAD